MPGLAGMVTEVHSEHSCNAFQALPFRTFQIPYPAVSVTDLTKRLHITDLGWRLTYVTDGGDRARNGVLAGGGGERVVNKWGALGG